MGRKGSGGSTSCKASGRTRGNSSKTTSKETSKKILSNLAATSSESGVVSINEAKGNKRKLAEPRSFVGKYSCLGLECKDLTGSDKSYFDEEQMCVLSHQEKNEAKIYYSVPASWVCQSRQSFLYPRFRVSNKLPSQWGLSVLKRFWCPMPNDEWEEFENATLQKYQHKEVWKSTHKFDQRSSILKRLKAGDSSLRDTDSDKQWGGHGTRARNIAKHLEKNLKVIEEPSTPVLDIAKNLVNQTCVESEPNLKVNEDAENSAKDSKQDHNNNSEDRSKDSSDEFADNLEENESVAAATTEEIDDDDSVYSASSDASSKVSLNDRSSMDGAEDSDSINETLPTPPSNETAEVTASLIQSDKAPLVAQTEEAADGTVALIEKDKETPVTRTVNLQENVTEYALVQDLSELSFQDCVAHPEIMNAVLFAKLDTIMETQKQTNTDNVAKFEQLTNMITKFVLSVGSTIADEDAVYKSADNYVGKHMKLPLTAIDQITPLNMALADDQLAASLCIKLIKDLDPCATADSIVNLTFSALFSEELGQNLQWRQRKGDYRFGISALFNIQAIFALNVEYFFKKMPAKFDEKRRKASTGDVCFTLLLIQKARKQSIKGANARTEEDAEHDDGRSYMPRDAAIIVNQRLPLLRAKIELFKINGKVE